MNKSNIIKKKYQKKRKRIAKNKKGIYPQPQEWAISPWKKPAQDTWKYVDVGIPFNDSKIINNSGQAIILNSTVQGTKAWERVGRKISMKSLRFSWNIVRNLAYAADAETDIEYIRLAIFYDTNPQTDISYYPVCSDLFQNRNLNGDTPTLDHTVLCYPNMDNSERFKILKDIRIPVSSLDTNDFEMMNANTVNYQNKMAGEIYLDLEGYDAIYAQGAFLPHTGALWFGSWGMRGNTNAPYSIQYSGRLRFIDWKDRTYLPDEIHEKEPYNPRTQLYPPNTKVYFDSNGVEVFESEHIYNTQAPTMAPTQEPIYPYAPSVTPSMSPREALWDRGVNFAKQGAKTIGRRLIQQGANYLVPGSGTYVDQGLGLAEQHLFPPGEEDVIN